MGKIIALANQKGGVGKTTSCINLAAALGQENKRVLLVDLDPQGNATMGSGVDKSQANMTVNELLMERINVDQAIIKTQAPYDLIAGNSDTTEAEISLLEDDYGRYTLQKVLQQVREKYDFILIDNPPSLNMLTVNALVAADSVIVPIQCEYYALEGLTQLIDTINQIRDTLNPKLHIEGLLRTMYDGRNRLAVDVSEQLEECFPGKVYQTVIPRNVRLAEAPSYGMPVLFYDKKSLGSQAYMAFAAEVLKQQKRAKKTELVTE